MQLKMNNAFYWIVLNI